MRIVNQKSIRLLDIVPKLTNFAVQNVNKALVYTTYWTCPLIKKQFTKRCGICTACVHISE